jgi:hypothetical protein
VSGATDPDNSCPLTASNDAPVPQTDRPAVSSESGCLELEILKKGQEKPARVSCNMSMRNRSILHLAEKPSVGTDPPDLAFPW